MHAVDGFEAVLPFALSLVALMLMMDILLEPPDGE